MSYKKYLIPVTFLFGIIFFLASIFKFSAPAQKEPLSLIPTNIPTETDVITALEKIIKEKREMRVKITENDTCYWVKPTNNGTHYLLQINKYNGIVEKCIGFPENIHYIQREKGLSIFGDTCICDKETYLLEWENSGIKVIKR